MLADLNTQRNVIAALTIRKLQGLMKSYNYGFAWALLEPIMFIGLMRLARKAFSGLTPPNMPPTTFLVVGIIPFYLYVAAVSSVSRALAEPDNMLQFPRVTQVDVAVASALSDCCIYLTIYAIFLIPASVVEQVFPPQNGLKLMVVVLTLWTMGMALGFVVGTAARVFPPIKQFVGYYNLVNRMVGGMLFVITMIPSAYWPYLSWNPVLHCSEMIRDAWFSTYTSPIASPLYVFYWIVGLLLLGLSLERYQRRMPYI